MEDWLSRLLEPTPAEPEGELVTDIDELMTRMTLEEKCSQLGCMWFSGLLVNGELALDRLALAAADGIGQVGRIAIESGSGPERVAELGNQVQRYFVEDTRLGIPAVIHEESTGGFCARQATQFPQGINLAATWDPALVEQVAEVIGRQLRAVGARLTLAPVLDIARDARWGRLEETYGEDPELASRMGVSYVRGVQTQGVIATAKHFLGYGAPEGGFNWGWSSMGPRHLRDVIAAPFRAVINEANVGAVMPSYNEIDGLPLHGSPELLTDLLRVELGFTGVTVADYFGVSSLEDFHHCASDEADAARRALLAGLDMELPSYWCYRHLPALVNAGTVPVEALDGSCRRVLAQKQELGLFDQPYVEASSAAALFDTLEDRALARRAASASVVLLTNDGVLPLGAGARVAVLGASADDPRLLLGDYHFPAHLELQQQEAALSPVGNEFRQLPPQNPTPTPLEALRQRVEIVDEVESAEAAIIFVGGRSGLTSADTSGEFRDTADLRLAPEQLTLISETAAQGVPVVVVVIGGRAHSLSDVAPLANALVFAGLPGEEGGNGLADVLCGDVDASGRLPVTLLHTVGQVGVHSGAHHGGGRSMIMDDYVETPATPLFPFGHGLSYTTWERRDLAVRAATTSDDVEVGVTLTNTGARAGTDVVQVFFRDEVASVGLPATRLLAFQRVECGAGASTRLTFHVPVGRLGFTGADLHYRVEPGEFTFIVGDLSTTVAVTGEITFPDRNVLPPVNCTD
jgi:beta-glucosidase